MQKRNNGEGNIRKRADGRYEVRVTGTDPSTLKPIRTSQYANTLEEAVQILHTLNITMMQNPQYFSDSITLGEWLDRWLEVYMRHSLKQSTYKSYESYARNHFKPVLGTTLLKNITPYMLQQFYNYKLTEGNLSWKTIHNLNLYLHTSLSQAVKEGLILSNPASALNLPRGARPVIEVLTRDQQAWLSSASYQHRYGVFVRLVLSTGLRLGELVGLRWVDIDFRSGMLHVRQTLNRLQRYDCEEDEPKTEVVFQTPKSQNSIRSIPLLPGLLSDLSIWRSTQMEDQLRAGDGYVPSDLVVTNELGGYIEPRTFRDYYHQMLTLAGLPHFTFHALRHTFATRAMEQGMDVKTLSILLGHASVSFTLDTYAHVLDSQKREAMQLMQELYAPQPVLVKPVIFS